MRARDNPREHRRMRGDAGGSSESMNEETDADETQTDGGVQAQKQPSADTDVNAGIEAEIDALNVHVFGEQKYVVGNPLEGTAYHVDLEDSEHDGTITCTCPDYRFRAADNEFRACKHIQAVLAAGDECETIERMAYDRLSQEYRLLQDKVDTVIQQLTAAQTNTTAAAESPNQNGNGGSVPASDAAGNGGQMEEVSIDEKAEKLQNAYDERVNGMNVEASGGKIWVNKTPDAPDYTFDAFLSGPRLMQYDPDDRSAPGQYFQNYVEPDDVDEYISEVLE